LGAPISGERVLLCTDEDARLRGASAKAEHHAKVAQEHVGEPPGQQDETGNEERDERV
jgi:hypothetical protein